MQNGGNLTRNDFNNHITLQTHAFFSRTEIYRNTKQQQTLRGGMMLQHDDLLHILVECVLDVVSGRYGCSKSTFKILIGCFFVSEDVKGYSQAMAELSL